MMLASWKPSTWLEWLERQPQLRLKEGSRSADAYLPILSEKCLEHKDTYPTHPVTAESVRKSNEISLGRLINQISQ
jgi:hypothetical protein